MIMPDDSRSLSLGEKLNIISFNFVSRFIGLIVRIILIVVGLFALFFVSIFGLFGFLFWVILPIFSLPLYMSHFKSPKHVVRGIVKKINEHPERAVATLLQNTPGQFVAQHLGLDIETLINSAHNPQIKLTKNYLDYSSVLSEFVQNKTWDDAFMVEHQLSAESFLIAAHWWDNIRKESTYIDMNPPMVHPGIGRRLLYGFTPNLDKFAQDLSFEQDFSRHLVGREKIVDRIDRTLAGGASIILTGAPGVGKKTVVFEFSKKAFTGELSPEMAYRKVLEIDLNFLAAESGDINIKKANLGKILAEASYAGNIVLVVKDLHRYTNSAVEGLDFTDVFENYLEKRTLKLVAMATRQEYERFIAPNSRLRKHFETIEIPEANKEETLEIMLEAANRHEKTNNLTITVPALVKIIDGADRFVTETPFPEKALDILEALVNYHNQIGGSNVIGVREAETVMTERTGVPFAAVNEEQSNMLSNLENIIHQRLVGQEEAVSLIAKVLRSKSAGVVNTKRPLGSFLFLGPTGVGKTETAKVLAKVYFGSEDAITRFDMAEYVGSEGLERLIGSQRSNQPGVLTNAIKNNPASLLLLDEIEKAPPQIFNLFLAMLDEGMITDAFGNKIPCSNLFVIATSNAGAEHIRELVGQNKLDDLHRNMTDYIMKQGHFSPELINRFDSVVVYKPLSREDLHRVAEIMFEEMSQAMKTKNINLSLDKAGLELLTQKGYQPEFGARPMRRVIDLEMGDLLGRAILSKTIVSGDNIKITSTPDGEFGFEKL